VSEEEKFREDEKCSDKSIVHEKNIRKRFLWIEKRLFLKLFTVVI
jgi:hypothetical protein